MIAVMDAPIFLYGLLVMVVAAAVVVVVVAIATLVGIVRGVGSIVNASLAPP